jgi:mannosyltransferase OCH1-like enzyme
MKMIPRVLHQFWDTGDPPESVRPLLASWHELNKDWKYHLWDDRCVIELIDAKFDRSILLAYEACKFPAMRADIARYLILWETGGAYADADLTCLKPLDDSVDPTVSLLVFRGWNGAWRNDFMAATPKCPILWQFIETAVANISARISPDNLWLVTGPGMTTPIIARALAEGEVKIQTFEFSEVKGRILAFHHDLDYRQGNKHWAVAQKGGIYRD